MSDENQPWLWQADGSHATEEQQRQAAAILSAEQARQRRRAVKSMVATALFCGAIIFAMVSWGDHMHSSTRSNAQLLVGINAVAFIAALIHYLRHRGP